MTTEKEFELMEDTTTEFDIEFPQCSSYDYRCPNAGGFPLPATRSIPIRPDTPNIRRMVCENCYYDYEFEGICTYSWRDTDELSEEERFKLWSKLNWDPDWRDK
jgi:hypothetical protein